MAEPPFEKRVKPLGGVEQCGRVLRGRRGKLLSCKPRKPACRVPLGCQFFGPQPPRLPHCSPLRTGCQRVRLVALQRQWVFLLPASGLLPLTQALQRTNIPMVFCPARWTRTLPMVYKRDYNSSHKSGVQVCIRARLQSCRIGEARKFGLQPLLMRPQGLKPGSFRASSGTAEAVP